MATSGAGGAFELTTCGAGEALGVTTSGAATEFAIVYWTVAPVARDRAETGWHRSTDSLWENQLHSLLSVWHGPARCKCPKRPVCNGCSKQIEQVSL